MERNILLTIEYDGSEFSGWQRQPVRRTVQGELEQVLSKVCGTPIQINGTSRTDAGVHALGQRASFKLESGIPTDKIKLAANNILAGGKNLAAQVGDVRILSVEEMSPDFHARFDCKGKEYIYKMHCSESKDPFGADLAYHYRRKFDVDAAREAAAHLVGTHDFASFCADCTSVSTTVRTIYSLEIENNGTSVIILVKGDGFLYNMIRIIAGTLMDVSEGRISPDDIPAILEAKDRLRAGRTAMAHGLYLNKVYYGGDVLEG